MKAPMMGLSGFQWPDTHGTMTQNQTKFRMGYSQMGFSARTTELNPQCVHYMAEPEKTATILRM